MITRRESSSVIKPYMFHKSFMEVYHMSRRETNVIIRHFAEKEFKNRLPAELLLWALAGANIAVFFTLRTKEYDEEFIYNNFTCNGFNLKEGRYHTLLTSSFGHRNVEGLLIDLAILAGFSTMFRVSARLRAWKLLVLYLGSGACGSFAESYRPAIYNSFASKESQQMKMYRPCFDSSASIYAIVVYSLGLGFNVEGTLRKAGMSFLAFGLVFLLRSIKEDLLGDNGMWQRDLVAAGMGWYFNHLWPFSL
jgi:membrane associated rhomboid family serine protease